MSCRQDSVAGDRPVASHPPPGWCLEAPTPTNHEVLAGTGQVVISNAMKVPIYLETGKKRVFACAVEWPGWSRSGKDEQAAIEALEAYAPRYAKVARRARVPFVKGELEFDVVERVKGSGSTDFGAPGSVPDLDREPIDLAERRRFTKLVRAAWKEFDAAVDDAPAELPKGPRGGGRDRDKVVDHAHDAEAAYGRSIGVEGPAIKPGDTDTRDAHREALAKALIEFEPEGKQWPIPYAARRIAWHVLDHAWELQDKSAAVAEAKPKK